MNQDSPRVPVPIGVLPPREEQPERMLKWFAWEHLPDKLGAVSRPFGDLAAIVATEIPTGPERTVALRKLLEAKDAAVRAALHPGC